MSLEETNKKLYRPELLPDPSAEGEVIHSQGELAEERAAFGRTEGWKDQSVHQDIYLVNPEAARRKKLWIWGAIAATALVLLAGGAYFGVREYLRGDRVTVQISGPQSVASAEDVSYTITFRNGNRVALENARLTLRFPGTFRPAQTPDKTWSAERAEKSMGAVAPGTDAVETITGRFFGAQGESGRIEAVLQYTPAGTSGNFEVKQEITVTLATSPVALEIEAPRELGPGQMLDYVITYRNTSPETLSNARLSLEYPQSFTFFSADPGPENGTNEWRLGDIGPNASGKIVVHGALSGAPNESKTIVATLGVLQGDNTLRTYNRVERGTRLATTPLTVTQTVNGATELTALPGDILTYVIRYANQGSVGMREAVITQSIDTAYLDVSRLELESGAYDAAQKMIVWRASDIPALGRLEPGASGEIRFTIPVLEQFASAGGPVSIRSVATIDSPDVQTPLGQNKIIGSNVIAVKLGAQVAFEVMPSVSDAPFDNSGPVPPRVGSETTYTLRVRVAASASELSGARLTLSLPSGVVYKGKSAPSDASVQWNARTNELAWNAGALRPDAPKELFFQVGITPNANQVGKPVVLIGRAAFEARENFTGRAVTAERANIENGIFGGSEPAASGIVEKAE